MFLEFFLESKNRRELHVLCKVFSADTSWDQDASTGLLRVGEVAKYLLRKDFIDFAVTWYWLRHAGFRIVIYHV